MQFSRALSSPARVHLPTQEWHQHRTGIDRSCATWGGRKACSANTQHLPKNTTGWRSRSPCRERSPPGFRAPRHARRWRTCAAAAILCTVHGVPGVAACCQCSRRAPAGSADSPRCRSPASCKGGTPYRPAPRPPAWRPRCPERSVRTVPVFRPRWRWPRPPPWRQRPGGQQPTAVRTAALQATAPLPA